MFAKQQLAISLSAAELRGVRRLGAVFPVDAVANAPFSNAVRRALDLICYHAKGMAKPPIIVARPEMYPDGAPLAWLMQQLDGVEDHVNISDGSIVKAIPGLRNHLFFCGLSTELGQARLDSLAERAIETFLPFEAQINTALAIRDRGRSLRLPTVSLAAPPSDQTSSTDAIVERFYLNPWSLEDSVNRIAMLDPQPLSQVVAGRNVTTVPTVEGALADPAYRRRIARLVAKHMFDPETVLILQTPLAMLGRASKADDDASVMYLLGAMRDTDVAIPRQPAANVFITRERVAPAAALSAAETTLFLSDANALWSYSAEEYAALTNIILLARRGRSYRKQFAELAKTLIQRDHLIEWLSQS